MTKAKERAFLQDICEHPDDDAPRLIYADWLQGERADELRRQGKAAKAHAAEDKGEFIRLQCQLANLDQESQAALPHGILPSPRSIRASREAAARAESRRQLGQQIARVLNEHQAEWERPLDELGFEVKRWERGFPKQVESPPDIFLASGDRLRDLAPGCTVGFPRRSLRAEDLPALLACPHLSGVAGLDLSGSHSRTSEIVQLAASPNVSHLRELYLSSLAVNDDSARALAASPHLRNLAVLAMRGGSLTGEGACALAESLHLPSLRHLDLTRNIISNAGARGLTLALSGPDSLPALTSVCLDDNDIGPRALRGVEQQLEVHRRAQGGEQGRPR